QIHGHLPLIDQPVGCLSVAPLKHILPLLRSPFHVAVLLPALPVLALFQLVPDRSQLVLVR
uniref:Uncharacterized protein n=1 Tax=Ciona savignyi TaxID=51511 RepID=H2Z430_CIOSA